MNRPRVIVTKEKNGYDITVWMNGKEQTAWAYDYQTAMQKARILADYYRDINGQSALIENNI